MISSSSRYLVAVIAFDRVIPFHLSVPCLVFGAVPDNNPFDVVVCAGETGPLRTSAGFGLTDLAPVDVLEQADILVVPGWRDTLDQPPDTLLEALRQAHERGDVFVDHQNSLASRLELPQHAPDLGAQEGRQAFCRFIKN